MQQTKKNINKQIYHKSKIFFFFVFSITKIYILIRRHFNREREKKKIVIYFNY